jgi:Sulfatase
MKPAFSFLIGLFGLAASAVPLLAVEDFKPNVVFFLADDLGFMDIGANNPQTFYETPNIDRLAAKGIALHERSLELPGVLVFAGEPDDRQVSPPNGSDRLHLPFWQPGGRAVRVRSRRRLEADRMVRRR